MGSEYSIGIDIGSISVKIAVVDSDLNIVKTTYRRFHGRPYQVLKEVLDSEYSDFINKPVKLGFTGIGRKTAISILGGELYGEISSIAAANFHLYPEIATIIEMGGEDSKYLRLDPENKVVVDFSMNNICAAGTGSFLDQQAKRLKISIEKEFGELALKSENPPRIAGRCSVFAKSDMIHLQQIATPDFDIVSGLCFAVARNFKGQIARGKKFVSPIAFEGGVAANPGVAKAFTEILELKEGELIIPEYHNVIGAIGAAIQLWREDDIEPVEIDTEKITGYLNYREVDKNQRDRLTFDFPNLKYYDITGKKSLAITDKLDVYLGLDIGSLSTNLVLIDKNLNVISRRYLMTEGRPIEAIRRGLTEIGDEVTDRVNVVGVGTTGSGRYLIADFVGGDIVKNEITAQATAAININPEVDTIFEIGGQDSKYISLDKKTVIDFEMNKACAAGTGSFLQEQAEKLNINIENEFGTRALDSKCPVGCGERCTVFMESDLVSHQRGGADTDDLVAGLAYSIASNYLNKVVGDRKVGDNIFFQGGVAWNKGVVAAFEKLTGKSVTVPPHHDITGAIGAAILAMEADSGQGSKFKGFDLSKRKYKITSFTCEDCDNMCEIRQVEMEGEEPLFYGSRCEKYDVKEKTGSNQIDYFNIRQKHLLKKYIDLPKPKKSLGRIGVPRILHFFEYYPFWKAILETIGFTIVNSDLSNHQIVEDSLEQCTAETCFPIKLAFGHVENLINKKVDYIFLPGVIEYTDKEKAEGNFICPYVQSISNTIKSKYDFDSLDIKFIGQPVRLIRDNSYMVRQIRELFKQLHLSESMAKKALNNGFRAYDMFRKELGDIGQKVLDSLEPDDKCMVVVTRPYTGFDRRLSLEIPSKVLKMGVKAIPIDFLPVDTETDNLSRMYWLFGRKILSAGTYIRKHPNLFAIYLTSFGCGPDSFITHFFRRYMTGKPYLQLELDEHSADAGIITRVEAFLDSLRFYNYEAPVSEYHPKQADFSQDGRVIYIPYMCDHAYAVRAAFVKCGLNAEVMNEPDDGSLELGKKFTSGKECFPCAITTGDMIKKIRSDGFERDKSIFFMPGADGPCRFGQYSQYHRIVLDELGYKDVPIYSPNSNTSYADFGIDATTFRRVGWQGVVFVDCLSKSLLKTRPYETADSPVKSEKVYNKYLDKLQECIINGGDLRELATTAAKEFALVKTDRSIKRPVVGVVGEIYLRNNRYSNNNVVTKLEALGLEVKLATFSEWINYTSLTYRNDSRINRDWKNFIKAKIQMAYQHRDEHSIEKVFAKYLPIDVEIPVDKIVDYAIPYIPVIVKGEAILSIGKAIDFIKNGACGVVNCMPFNCMPGIIVTSFSRKVSQDFNDVPWLNLSYEGLQDTGEETRLEAFADQAKSAYLVRS